MGEKSCPLIAWQTKSGAFTLRFFIHSILFFRIRNRDMQVFELLLITFASLTTEFRTSRNSRILFLNLCTL